MLLKYCGGTPLVYVPDAEVYVGRGDSVDVPDAVAGGEPDTDGPGEGLLAQPIWRRVEGVAVAEED